jgi:hypothetical protein
MERKNINALLAGILVCTGILLSTSSCEKEGKCGEVNISAAGEAESHNFGMNCMNCSRKRFQQRIDGTFNVGIY